MLRRILRGLALRVLGPIEIEVCRRRDGQAFHAKFANGSEKGVWGIGKSEQGAVGSLVFYNQEGSGIRVRFLEGVIR